MIENVKMMLCPGCIKYGEGVKEIHGSPLQVRQSLLKRNRRIKEKDVYEKMNIEIISDWGTVIKSARRKKGLSREQLGFNIGEPTGTISKIEKGELRPSDKVAKRLEKELDIKLFEEVKEVTTKPIIEKSQGLTLGDFIKKE
jgi:putative transcription factor